MAKLLNLLTLFLVLSVPAAVADIYKCSYEDGSDRLSDNNCPRAISQVDMSLKGSWMMRKPKGSHCKVTCDANYCRSSRAKVKVFDRKKAVFESLENLPKAHYQQKSPTKHCKNCRGKKRRSKTDNACKIVVYQTVIKQFFNSVSRQVIADLAFSKKQFEEVQESCEGPDAAKPKRESVYGELLSCKEQSVYRVGLSQARMRYHRVQREHLRLTAGAETLELKARQ